MARDFSNEAPLNLVFRGMRSLSIRLRGRLLAGLGTFAPGSGRKIGFAAGPKFTNSRGIAFANHVSFGRMARIECHGNPATGKTGEIRFGTRTSFGDFLHVGAITRIEIGNNVLGGSHILIVDHNHGTPKRDVLDQTSTPPRERPLSSPGPIVIEDDVWIADQVVILGGVTIGKGAIIATQSVIRQDVPAYSIFANGQVLALSAR